MKHFGKNDRDVEYDKYHKEILNEWEIFSEEHGPEDMELLLKLGENLDEIRSVITLVKNLTKNNG